MNQLSIDQMIHKGWGRSATVGTFSNGIGGGGGVDVLLIGEPELVIGVPAGLCIRPIRMSAQAQMGPLAGTKEAEILFAVDSLGLWRGDGTHTVETPSNMLTSFDKGSSCRVGSAFNTVVMTTTPGYAVQADAAPVLDMELARKVVEIDDGAASDTANTQMICDLLYEPDYPPYLVGPCTLFVYMGGDTGIALVDAFAQVQWVEGPKNMMLPPI